MNELKPVAHVVEDLKGGSDYMARLADPLPPVGTKLYAIPDTHRVVSVEALKYLLAILDDNMTYAAASEINAIIDNKEAT